MAELCQSWINECSLKVYLKSKWALDITIMSYGQVWCCDDGPMNGAPLFLDSSGPSCNLRPGTIKPEGEKAPANLLPASGAVFCVTEVRL